MYMRIYMHTYKCIANWFVFLVCYGAGETWFNFPLITYFKGALMIHLFNPLKVS